MATTAGQVLTLEEFLALPEEKPAQEFFGPGEVHQMPMPELTHAYLQEFFTVVLRAFVRPRRLGRSGVELRCVFGPPGRERAFVPDVAFIATARLPAGDPRDTPVFRAAPDLAIEILSPDHHIARTFTKILFYLQHGVRLLWLVDPRAETVTVFAPGQDAVELSGAEVLDGGAVLPGFALPIRDIWAELAPVEGAQG